jgi:hypothetical protein
VVTTSPLRISAVIRVKSIFAACREQAANKRNMENSLRIFIE